MFVLDHEKGLFRMINLYIIEGLSMFDSYLNCLHNEFAHPD